MMISRLPVLCSNLSYTFIHSRTIFSLEFSIPDQDIRTSMWINMSTVTNKYDRNTLVEMSSYGMFLFLRVKFTEKYLNPRENKWNL